MCILNRYNKRRRVPLAWLLAQPRRRATDSRRRRRRRGPALRRLGGVLELAQHDRVDHAFAKLLANHGDVHGRRRHRVRRVGRRGRPAVGVPYPGMRGVLDVRPARRRRRGPRGRRDRVLTEQLHVFGGRHLDRGHVHDGIPR